ncbi:uncharacterized protein CTRU02_212571 [Colletotrichum truncatum]|uniref:Uncharacterized protein n=1 Tax=Colletotrichum truncatum TaxID=5467 RepID=A0ACC3YID3_COLTU
MSMPASAIADEALTVTHRWTPNDRMTELAELIDQSARISAEHDITRLVASSIGFDGRPKRDRLETRNLQADDNTVLSSAYTVENVSQLM